MKNIYLLLFVIISYSLTAQSVEKTEFRGEILNGKIKLITQTEFNKFKKFSQSNKFNKKIDTMFYCFNELGLLVEAKEFKNKTFYTYNSDNQIIISNTYHLRFEGIKARSNEYIYENGNLIKHILKYPPSNSHVTNYFDYFITHYDYDTNGKIIEDRKFSKHRNYEEESFYHHYKYQYDTLGNCIIKERLDKNGDVKQINENKYLNNKLIETFIWQEFEDENSYSKNIYVYDENENLDYCIGIGYMYGSTTNIANKHITNYFYDDKQRLIKIEESYRATYYQDFDTKDNWQKKIIDEKDKQRIILRKFEYYDE